MIRASRQAHSLRDRYILAPVPLTTTRHRGQLIDWIAVERAANGRLDNPGQALTRAEKEQAWLLMDSRGYPPTVIGRHTGSNGDTVGRWLRRRNTTPAAAARKDAA